MASPTVYGCVCLETIEIAPVSRLIACQCVQGQEPASTGRDASWPLAPAQEHKYDALAAFDAGQLQEAQHAFDLSVWSDLKNDRGGLPADLLQLSSHLLEDHVPEDV